MRTIKFRAWQEKQPHRSCGVMSYSSDYNSLSEFFNDTAGEELMQFTGLHDKNGKEIYEGDIMTSVRNGERMVCEVMWIAESAAFSIWWYDEPEIIGNIFKNPELIP